MGVRRLSALPLVPITISFTHLLEIITIILQFKASFLCPQIYSSLSKVNWKGAIVLCRQKCALIVYYTKCYSAVKGEHFFCACMHSLINIACHCQTVIIMYLICWLIQWDFFTIDMWLSEGFYFMPVWLCCSTTAIYFSPQWLTLWLTTALSDLCRAAYTGQNINPSTFMDFQHAYIQCFKPVVFILLKLLK